MVAANSSLWKYVNTSGNNTNVEEESVERVSNLGNKKLVVGQVDAAALLATAVKRGEDALSLSSRR